MNSEISEELLTVEESTPEETAELAPKTEAEPAFVPETVTGPESAPETVAEVVDVTERLATEFLALSEEFPDLRDPDLLPDEVLDTAATEGIPLLDAYLRFRWQEEKRVRAEEQTRRAAARKSAGSLAQERVESHPEQEAFSKAFRSTLG